MAAQLGAPSSLRKLAEEAAFEVSFVKACVHTMILAQMPFSQLSTFAVPFSYSDTGCPI